MSNYISFYKLNSWWDNELNSGERKIITEKYYENIAINEIHNTSQSKLTFLTDLGVFFKKPETYLLAKKIIEKASQSITKSDDILDVHFHYHNKIEIYYRNRENDPEALTLAIKACKDQILMSKKVAKAFFKIPIKSLENVIQATKDLIKIAPELKETREKGIQENEYKLSKLKKQSYETIKGNLPEHTGYKQLAIILFKQNKYEEVITLCLKAKKEGWGGDWDKRILKAKIKGKIGDWDKPIIKTEMKESKPKGIKIIECYHCGYKYNSDNSFCPKCGKEEFKKKFS